MRVVPMIFNTEMVKALIAGDKVVTRRPAKNLSFCEFMGFKVGKCGLGLGFTHRQTMNNCIRSKLAKCPAQRGDLIYVRETWGVVSHEFNEHGVMVGWTPDRPSTQVNELRFGNGYYTGHVIYRADGDMRWCNDFEDEVSAWKPSIHMPRRASRITLKVTDVRIERVHDITEEQCWKEGIEQVDGQFDIYQLSEMAKTFGGTFEDAKSSFACLWDSIYRNWSDNPYVWVIEFELIKENVDKYIQSLN